MMKRYIYEFHRNISLVDLNKKGVDGWKLFSYDNVDLNIFNIAPLNESVIYYNVTLEKLLP